MSALGGCSMWSKEKLNILRNGRTISFHMPLSSTVKTVEVRLFSKANDYIFEYDDESPYAPKVENEQTKAIWMAGFDEAAAARKTSSREQRFPVVDIILKPGMDAVVEMDLQEEGAYEFNEHESKTLTEEIYIPAGVFAACQALVAFPAGHGRVYRDPVPGLQVRYLLPGFQDRA